MTAYRIALPHPWTQVRLDSTMRDRVREILDDAMSRLPSDVPPDQVAQNRIKLEGSILTQLRQAQEHGGIDFYFPAEAMHGMQLSASFIVSEIIPDAMAETGGTGRVMATLIHADEDARPITVANTVWVRTERPFVREPDAEIDAKLTGRRVDYRTAVPDDERRWVVVAFSTPGDGDPDSELTALLVELFDAITSTWRWEETA